MLTASGNQFKDWSAAYRIFKGERMDMNAIFSEVRKEIVYQNRKTGDFIYAYMDDTLLRNRGKKISGTGWQRDPLGPRFLIISFGANDLFNSLYHSLKKTSAVHQKLPR